MNEHQRRREEAQRASRQFLQALSAGQVHAYDRFGNPILPGVKLVYRVPEDPVFDVVSITPVLEPNQPAGLLDLTLTATVKVRVGGNQQVRGAICVGPAPQQPAAPAPDPPTDSPSADPPTPDPPTDDGPSNVIAITDR